MHFSEVLSDIAISHKPVKHIFHFFEPAAFNGISGYIDGGNSCIIKTPWYCVHLVRGACCLLKGTVLSSFNRWEFFLVAKNSKHGSTLKTYGAPDFFQIPDKLDVSCADTGNKVRELFEKAIITWSKELCLEFMVVDGLHDCAQMPFPVIGLAKTTEQADMALLQQPGIWWTEHNGTFCRLNANAHTILRYEGNNALLPQIAYLSRDLVFPGYPYGLIVVDRFARVSNEERDYLLYMFESMAGKEWLSIRDGMRLLNAHNILDSIA